MHVPYKPRVIKLIHHIQFSNTSQSSQLFCIAMATSLVIAFCVMISFVGCAYAQPRAFFVFGDSLVDSGNNDFLATTARADNYPYGIDYPSHRPTGRFSNGYNIPDLISKIEFTIATKKNLYRLGKFGKRKHKIFL